MCNASQNLIHSDDNMFEARLHGMDLTEREMKRIYFMTITKSSKES